jgi:pimeloyl-ACP methyl ester carboxylesterase
MQLVLAGELGAEQFELHRDRPPERRWPVPTTSADLCGHSYGGWLALRYALHSPQRARRLALLDPAMCFTGTRLSYRLHAVPFRPGLS